MSYILQGITLIHYTDEIMLIGPTDQEVVTWGNQNTGWKRISRYRSFQKGVSLLRAGSRDKEGTANSVGQSPDRPGKVESFHGLLANFYSLQVEQYVIGLVATGWLLGWAFLPKLRSGSPLVMIRGALCNSYKGIQLASEVTSVLGSTSMVLVQGHGPVALGQNSIEIALDVW